MRDGSGALVPLLTRHRAHRVRVLRVGDQPERAALGLVAEEFLAEDLFHRRLGDDDPALVAAELELGVRLLAERRWALVNGHATAPTIDPIAKPKQQRDAVATPNSRSPVKRLVLRWGASAPQRREIASRWPYTRARLASAPSWRPGEGEMQRKKRQEPPSPFSRGQYIFIGEAGKHTDCCNLLIPLSTCAACRPSGMCIQYSILYPYG